MDLFLVRNLIKIAIADKLLIRQEYGIQCLPRKTGEEVAEDSSRY